MKTLRFIVPVLFGLASGSAAFAECNALTDAELRSLKSAYAETKKTLRKAVARADGQVLRQMSLNSDALLALPPLPGKPILPTEGFDAEGVVQITCGEDGTAADAIAAAQAAIDEAQREIGIYSQKISAREQSLITAEEGGTDTAATDDTASDTDGDTAANPGADDGADDSADDGADVTATPDAGGADPDIEDDFAALPDIGDDPVADPDAGADADPDTDAGVDPNDDFGFGDDPDTDSVQPGEPADVASKDPMPDPDNPNLFRRVISLPGAGLRTEASDGATAEPLPTFSVLYVFDENQTGGQSWLEVGTSLREDSSGWIKADEGLNWSSMLVMSFAPRGSRSDVLFFKQDTALIDLVNSAFYKADADRIYDQLRTQRDMLIDNADHAPTWPSELVAVEPETAVTFNNQPYLLPILDWREEAFDGADDTVLLKVAAVPSNATNIGATDEGSFNVSSDVAAANSDGVFRIGVVFVLDTTVSMRPFIDRTNQTVEAFFNAFSQLETAQNVSFGLVGYRDNTDRDPVGLEYTARMFQPLDIEADPRTVVATARQMKEATVPTIGFKEDGFKGIHTAISEMDWAPYDARLIVMVTDASSREGADPLAALPDTNAERLAELANLNNVAMSVVHLSTPANNKSGDFGVAADQYRALTATGDLGTDKYFAIDGTSDEEFTTEMNLLSNTVAQAVVAASAGKLVIDVEDLEPVPNAGSDEPGKLARALKTEIFRAQLESLAAQGNGDAPSFLEGWAADKDLTDPTRKSLDVSVFLTRNQLSSLDKQLDAIIAAFRSGGDDPKAAFENLQRLAAEMSTDPDKPLPEGRDVVRTILPAFLQNLPYRSQILRLDEEYWLNQSVPAQQEFIENLEAKRKIYADLDENTQRWVNFGANDPGLEATPVSLVNLP